MAETSVEESEQLKAVRRELDRMDEVCSLYWLQRTLKKVALLLSEDASDKRLRPLLVRSLFKRLHPSVHKRLKRDMAELLAKLTDHYDQVLTGRPKPQNEAVPQPSIER